MKKRLVRYFLFFTFLFVLFVDNVFAVEYETKTLIPIDTTATVTTTVFKYNDFIFNSKVLDKDGKPSIVFSSIENTYYESKTVSVNILLFDEDRKNIGFMAYCSDRDYDSSLYNTSIPAGQSIQYSMTVYNMYFGEGFTAKDVKFFAILDDNKHCKKGGSTNYLGLTMEQIKAGVQSMSSIKQKIFSFVSGLNLQFIKAICIFFAVIFFSFYISGTIINILHKKVYNCKNGYAYLPVCNMYVSVKLAFGPWIAKCYIIGLIIGLLLSIVGIGILITGLLSIVAGASFIVVIFKIITKKYDLLIVDPVVLKGKFVSGSPVRKNRKDSKVNIFNKKNNNSSLSDMYNSSNNNFNQQNNITSSVDDSFNSQSVIDTFDIDNSPLDLSINEPVVTDKNNDVDLSFTTNNINENNINDNFNGIINDLNISNPEKIESDDLINSVINANDDDDDLSDSNNNSSLLNDIYNSNNANNTSNNNSTNNDNEESDLSKFFK